jgi:hypothetical protein
MTGLNAATRLVASEPRLTRQELCKRARDKGYKVTDRGTRVFVTLNRYTSLVFYEDGSIFFADMDLSAAKKIPLKEAFRILKLL